MNFIPIYLGLLLTPDYLINAMPQCCTEAPPGRVPLAPIPWTSTRESLFSIYFG